MDFYVDCNKKLQNKAVALSFILTNAFVHSHVFITF